MKKAVIIVLIVVLHTANTLKSSHQQSTQDDFDIAKLEQELETRQSDLQNALAKIQEEIESIHQNLYQDGLTDQQRLQIVSEGIA